MKQFWKFLKEKNWPALFGYVFFIGFMVGGYYYNLKFVQLGLPDLGERYIGLNATQMSRIMSILAIETCIVAVVTVVVFTKMNWGRNFQLKLQIALAIGVTQVILTLIAPTIRTEQALVAWIVTTSVILGIGIPITFSFLVDLIPVQDRGMVAGLITGITYFLGNVSPFAWNIESFTQEILFIMVPGVVMLVVLVALDRKLGLVSALAKNATDPAFSQGRFLPEDGAAPDFLRDARYWLCLAFMFMIFFVDSLGFLRILDTPIHYDSSWHGDFKTRLVMATTHLLVALLMGYIYSLTNERVLILVTFGLFVVAQGVYAGIGDSVAAPLMTSSLYCAAVSTYTVINFTAWGDFSNRDTAVRNGGIGVAISGWLATFSSTSISIAWTPVLTFSQHLTFVATISGLTFLAYATVLLLQARGVIPGAPHPLGLVLTRDPNDVKWADLKDERRSSADSGSAETTKAPKPEPQLEPEPETGLADD
ncbi:MAG: MFS transporter [Promethearchaeota archaeon]